MFVDDILVDNDLPSSRRTSKCNLEDEGSYKDIHERGGKVRKDDGNEEKGLKSDDDDNDK